MRLSVVTLKIISVHEPNHELNHNCVPDESTGFSFGLHRGPLRLPVNTPRVVGPEGPEGHCRTPDNLFSGAESGTAQVNPPNSSDDVPFKLVGTCWDRRVRR